MPEVIKALLRSRSFITAIIAVVGTIIVTFVPAFAPHVGTLQTVILALSALLIGGWKLEDFAEKFNSSGATQKLEEFFAIVLGILDEMSKKVPDTEVGTAPKLDYDPNLTTRPEVETPING